MNIQQLRQSLKLKWLSYYENNRSWLVKMRLWGTYDGQRRPSSGFILATVSILEPQLEQIFPFILELNNDPDQIIAALGLNFNPEEQLHLIGLADSVAEEVKSESLHQTLEHQPLTDIVAIEGESQAIASVAVNTEVPAQMLSEYQPLTLSAIFPEEESQKSLQSVAVADTKVERTRQSIPLVAFFRNKVDKSKPRSLVAVATSDGESKSKPMSLGAFIARELESKPVQSVSFATQVENKDRLVTVPQKEVHNQVNPPPTSKASHLANWIDDFCRGVGGDTEETNSMKRND